MEIRVIQPRQDDLVARELIVGEPEGEFRLHEDGTVWYSSPNGGEELLAGTSLDQFMHAVDSWNSYCQSVRATDSEEAAMSVVARLRDDLESTTLRSNAEIMFWQLLVEQAEDGLL